jgi:hypothetical protein
MRQRVHSQLFFSARKARRERVLRKTAAMRAAKDRKRRERIAAGWTPEPKMVRWVPLELGLRDKITGEVAWTDFRSLRDALRRLAKVRRWYRPGIRSFPSLGGGAGKVQVAGDCK